MYMTAVVHVFLSIALVCMCVYVCVCVSAPLIRHFGWDIVSSSRFAVVCRPAYHALLCSVHSFIFVVVVVLQKLVSPSAKPSTPGSNRKTTFPRPDVLGTVTDLLQDALTSVQVSDVIVAMTNTLHHPHHRDRRHRHHLVSVLS